MGSSTERNWSKALIVSTACAIGTGIVIAIFTRQRRRQEKPQRRFRNVLADNTDEPFLHLSRDPQQRQSYPDYAVHPYVHEILELKKENVRQTLPVPQRAHTSVPCVWVDAPKQLDTVIEEIKNLDCFALDTEHHKHRSYHGFVCLIQIFTGECVYLIDAIALHDELHALNSVFSDPKIRKVVHGCHNDIVWLQRDFRVYVVNVFDTEKACQVLKKPKSNLAHLLESYFNVQTDKSMQQADWRKRPLSEDQLLYAKLDVTYLLSLEDILKRELMSSEKLFTKAVQKSQDLSLNLFHKWTSSEAATSAALQLIRRYFDTAGKSLHQGDYDLSQERPFMTCIYRLCIWRDAVARVEDESPEYILKSKLLSLLARELPTTHVELLECLEQTPLYDYSSNSDSPSYWNPPFAFLRRVEEVVDVIQEVKNGRYVWNDGPAMLDPSNKTRKTKSKKTADAVRERTVEIYCAKSKVYENCKMLSLNGELLCYCDRRNLEWYVRKKIAKVESENPYVIRLLFQHRTEDEANGSHGFYVQSRVNCCVACGEEGHYLRYKIVPACYRKHFPIPLKSHRSHDVVLLCIDCHHIAQTAADRLKRKLAEEYEVPLTNSVRDDDEKGMIHPCKVRAAALALQNNKERIPPQRLFELEQTIHLYFGRDPKRHGPISAEDMKLALLVGMSKRELKKTIKQENGSGLEICLSSLPKCPLDSGEQIHGEQVVRKAIEHGGEAELYSVIRRFREVFLEALQPQYLPKKWDVDHFAPRKFGEHSVFYQSNDTV